VYSSVVQVIAEAVKVNNPGIYIPKILYTLLICVIDSSVSRMGGWLIVHTLLIEIERNAFTLILMLYLRVVCDLVEFAELYRLE
jgi:hypothetical protein